MSGFEVALYAASVDPPETNTEFAKHLDLDFPILSDPSKKTANAYGVIPPGKEYAARWTFIIGKDGKVLDVIRNVNPLTHGKDLAARLGELGVPRRAGPSLVGKAAASASAAASAGPRPSASAH